MLDGEHTLVTKLFIHYASMSHDGQFFVHTRTVFNSDFFGCYAGQNLNRVLHNVSFIL